MYSFEVGRYIITSLCIHGALIFLLLYMPSEHMIRQAFLVHPEDKKEAYTFYKPVSTVGTYIPEAKKIPPKKLDVKHDHDINKEQTPNNQRALPQEQKKASISNDQKQIDAPQPSSEKKQNIQKPLKEDNNKHLKNQIKKKPLSHTKSPKTKARQQGQRLAMYQAFIQQAISRSWHPPVGIPKGTECAVHIKVDRQGKITSTNITQPSSIIVFTLSIQRALSSCQFNQQLWGKSFTVTFRQ